MRITVVLLLACSSALAQAQGSTVYKTVDENGVVSFSDTPPAGSTDTQTLQVDAPPPQSDGQYQANLEAMRETTDRMADDRREREKHRAEMRELNARTSSYGQSGQPEVIEYDNYLPSYSSGYYGGGHYRPGKPPWRPGYRPKPEHPIARPVPQPHPGNQRPTQGNAQLMRPITTR